MITQALVVAEPGAPFKYQDVEVEDVIRDNEVLVQLKATGVCHTDLNFAKEDSIPGLHPVVLGHEGAGIVSKTGSKVTSVAPGDHVLITYGSCGHCKYCLNHETSYCNDWFKTNFGVGRFEDGSKAFSSSSDGTKITSHFFGQSTFARHAVVMERCLVKIDKNLPLKVLAPMGCGIQTGAGAMLNVVRPTTNTTVVIVGVGSVGLAALMATSLAPSKPSKIIAVDIMPQRLELAKSFGATHTVNSKEQSDLKAALMDLTDGMGIDAAIDTTGRPDVVESLLKSSASKGKIVTVGVGKLTAEVSTSIFETVNTGRTYVGCCMGNCYPQEFIPMLITAWQEDKFPFDKLIKTFPAKEMERVAEEALSGKTIKPVVFWD